MLFPYSDMPEYPSRVPPGNVAEMVGFPKRITGNTGRVLFYSDCSVGVYCSAGETGVRKHGRDPHGHLPESTETTEEKSQRLMRRQRTRARNQRRLRHAKKNRG